MKVGHVVAYVSGDGAFGGPVAVAVGQSTELALRGHSVSLVAGWDRVVQLHNPGIQHQFFGVIRPFGRRLSGIVSLGLLRHIWQSGSTYDILHIHLGRDLTTSLAAVLAMLRGVPFVVQTHGMVMPDNRLVVRLFDAVIMRRLLATSVRTFTLSPSEEEGIREVSRSAAVTEMITNGMRPNGERPSTLARERPRVVFLARLHPRKQVMIFASAAAQLLESGTQAEFAIFGPDEGDLAELLQFLSERNLADLTYEGAVAPGEGASILANADVYVLPSVGEVVPMTVLEAMAVGTPVVLTNDCAMASKLGECGAAMVTDGSVGQVAESISRLLEDSTHAASVVANASTLLGTYYSVSAIAARLEKVYEPSEKKE